MFDKKEWLLDVVDHQNMVKLFVRYIANTAISNSLKHDSDKLEFVKQHEFVFSDFLEAWKATGVGLHRSEQCTGSHHHVENISDISELVEMVADWCSAFIQRTHCEFHKLSDKKDEAITKWAEVFQQLPWEKLLRNTMDELYNTLFGGLL